MEFRKRLLEIADTAIYVHEGLMERELGSVKESVLIGHGVDFEEFAAARPLSGPRIPIPEPCVICLNRWLVFTGMDEYRMDVDLMIKIARHIHRATLVLIGPQTNGFIEGACRKKCGSYSTNFTL
ncbi:MAG: hypothetical protein R3E08_01815 [Thiotrichaceae bacterium]